MIRAATRTHRPILVASIVVAADGLAGPISALSAPSASEPLMHTTTSFEVMVHLPLAETAPLFGPEGERPWAGKHWDPQFIHPQPAHDEGGAVCTVNHGPFNAVWVITQFDVAARHFQYAYFISDIMVTTIDVRFTALDATTTRVKVVYARTAVTTAGNEHVAAMTEGDKRSGKDWQEAIDQYLAARKPEARP
jgi:hypothetical protein